MYKLIGNRVLYEDVKIETKTPGGLYIPESAVKSQVDIEKGKVITYGDVVDTFMVGDIITVKKHSYKTAVKINNKSYKIVDVEDIIAVERAEDSNED